MLCSYFSVCVLVWQRGRVSTENYNLLPVKDLNKYYRRALFFSRPLLVHHIYLDFPFSFWVLHTCHVDSNCISSFLHAFVCMCVANFIDFPFICFVLNVEKIVFIYMDFFWYIVAAEKEKWNFRWKIAFINGHVNFTMPLYRIISKVRDRER